MSESIRSDSFQQLRAVIAWEVEAQVAVNRPVEEFPTLIADTLLDFFEVSLKPGVNLTELG